MEIPKPKLKHFVLWFILIISLLFNVILSVEIYNHKKNMRNIGNELEDIEMERDNLQSELDNQ